jgi:periplasmic protein TonB
MRQAGLLIAVFITAALAGSAFAQDQDAPPPEQSQPPSPPRTDPTRIRVGGNVMSAKIVHRVQPKYPEEAKKEHVSGIVLLRVIILKDGSLGKIDVVSGPALLVDASVDAVRKWRYKPTTLNDRPVEVETTISVEFNLSE